MSRETRLKKFKLLEVFSSLKGKVGKEWTESAELPRLTKAFCERQEMTFLRLCLVQIQSPSDSNPTLHQSRRKKGRGEPSKNKPHWVIQRLHEWRRIERPHDFELWRTVLHKRSGQKTAHLHDLNQPPIEPIVFWHGKIARKNQCQLQSQNQGRSITRIFVFSFDKGQDDWNFVQTYLAGNIVPRRVFGESTNPLCRVSSTARHSPHTDQSTARVHFSIVCKVRKERQSVLGISDSKATSSSL